MLMPTIKLIRFKWGDILTYKVLSSAISNEMQENLNIDFQTSFGFELNDYDGVIIGMVDDAQQEDPLRSNIIYILLPYFI